MENLFNEYDYIKEQDFVEFNIRSLMASKSINNNTICLYCCLSPLYSNFANYVLYFNDKLIVVEKDVKKAICYFNKLIKNND